MAGVVSHAGEWRIFKSITFSRAAVWVMTLSRIWSPFVLGATKKPIDYCTHLTAVSRMIENQRPLVIELARIEQTARSRVRHTKKRRHPQTNLETGN
jgi:hypothetical protein